MAQKFSTCLVNLLTGGRNLRSILDNCVLDIYTGAAPADADAAATGTRLCRVSVSSTIYGATGTTFEPTLENWYFYFPPDMGPTAAKTVIVAISVDGVNSTHTYAITAGMGASALAEKVANMINQSQRPVRAIGISGPTGASGAARVFVSPVVRGIGMTLVDGGGDDTILPYRALPFTKPNSLQFGPPLAGVISKIATDTWTGVNQAAGVAGYFRLVLPNDNPAIDSTFIYPRIQGSVGTSGADMNLDSVQFVEGATTTISAFSIQEPTSA